ncbi:MAG: hypothetical protein EU550_02590 [Promethearchaeota archaeon]|nr:MAG: hypothetical protein EU550_02590 [Candidatus Lokiarchaeota archaeon]
MNLNKKVYVIEIFGIILFITLITIAMFTYAGGTWDDPSYVGYNFWGNTFSDLGRLVTYNGKINLVSMMLFSISYTGIAVMFIPFYLIFQNLFTENKKSKISALIGSVFGIISSICFIGVVFTPADLLRPPHMIFANLAYASIFFMGVGYTIALYLSDLLPQVYTYIFVIFSILFFIILMLEIVGLNISRIFLVVGQKLGRIAIFASFIILTYGLWKLEE